MHRGISLASKCLLLFGGAVVLIILAALVLPWFRISLLIDAGELELSRQMVATWQRLGTPPALTDAPVERGGVMAREINVEQARALAASDPFLRDALARFSGDERIADMHKPRWAGTTREYRYLAAVRSGSTGQMTLEGVVLLERRSVEAARLLIVSTAYLILAGAAMLAMSLVTFYFITRKLILRPVRTLKETAERVREGNLSIRSEITTGDEFQELAQTFNSLLTDMQSSQDQLRSINAALDIKLNELAQANTALFESARLKGDFLANVSHELRTPLNSIIGFAELLLEISRGDAAAGESSPQVLKRIRYGENIVSAGRNLLAMINSLLEMAKIDAGRVDVHVERMNLRDACEGLVGLIYPLAEKKGTQVTLEVAEDVPVIRTDIKKFQQIIFNFLSNAVKFTEPQERSGRTPQVTLRAERLLGGRPGQPEDRVRVSVIDNGPGIPAEEQPRIFEKFHQVETVHTREHAGTGLGLAISKELAGILHGEIQLVSELGRGSMFSLILPLNLEEHIAAEAALESKFKGTLATRRAW